MGLGHSVKNAIDSTPFPKKQSRLGFNGTIYYLTRDCDSGTAKPEPGPGNANALLAKLDGAYSKLEDRRARAAANKVRAFSNQVSAFVQTGKLSIEQAELLLVGAGGITG